MSRLVLHSPVDEGSPFRSAEGDVHNWLLDLGDPCEALSSGGRLSGWLPRVNKVAFLDVG